MTELPQPGQRIALRYRDGSGPRELIGYVRWAGPEGLAMLDRTLAPRLLAWATLESWRAVPQVPRGRNPVAADPAMLDRMAGDDRLSLPGAPDTSAEGDQDICQVARLADLLGPAVPDQGPEAYDLGDGLAENLDTRVAARAITVGEWATVRVVAGPCEGTDAGQGAVVDPAAVLAVVLPLARWAAYRDARNVQVRGTRIRLEGFSELRRT